MSAWKPGPPPAQKGLWWTRDREGTIDIVLVEPWDHEGGMSVSHIGSDWAEALGKTAEWCEAHAPAVPPSEITSSEERVMAFAREVAEYVRKEAEKPLVGVVELPVRIGGTP